MNRQTIRFEDQTSFIQHFSTDVLEGNESVMLSNANWKRIMPTPNTGTPGMGGTPNTGTPGMGGTPNTGTPGMGGTPNTGTPGMGSTPNTGTPGWGH